MSVNRTLRKVKLTPCVSCSAPETDSEVRWCLLKVADLLIRGSEEQPPKVTIHLPPTPVVEAPPPIIPPVKLNTKPPRAIKASGPPTPSPRTSFTLPPKLKLVPSSAQVDASSAPTPSTVAPEAAPRKRGGDFHVPKVPSKAAPAHKEKPGRVAPRAHASGMSAQDLMACKNALKKLQEHKKGRLFLQPVDPVRDRAPKCVSYASTMYALLTCHSYFDIIKSPMDLGTMDAKLKQGQYKNRFEFEADFKLMINNAKTYNMQGSFAYNEAIALDSFFDKSELLAWSGHHCI